MSHIHLSQELLRAVASGRIPARSLVEIGLEHLRGICPSCAAELDAWQRERVDQRGFTQLIFDILPLVLAHQVPRMKAKELEAAGEMAELCSLSHLEALRKVRRARRKFQGPALVRSLLGASLRGFVASPRRALHFAELAREISGTGSIGEGHPELLALSLAYMANASRVLGDLLAAERTLQASRMLIQLEGISNPSVLADIDSIEATLRSEQRRDHEAETLLNRAGLLISLTGDRERIVRFQLQRASVYSVSRRPDRALEACSIALTMVEEEKDQQLFLWARFNLATSLADLGRFEEAICIVDNDENRHREFDAPLVQARYRWLRGTLASRKGQREEARRLLSEVLEVFFAAGSLPVVEVIERQIATLP